jgi:CheY-like chemotaxis protein
VIPAFGQGRDIDQKQGYEAGADDYITSPSARPSRRSRAWIVEDEDSS